jgi:hypothetical protein
MKYKVYSQLFLMSMSVWSADSSQVFFTYMMHCRDRQIELLTEMNAQLRATLKQQGEALAAENRELVRRNQALCGRNLLLEQGIKKDDKRFLNEVVVGMLEREIATLKAELVDYQKFVAEPKIRKLFADYLSKKHE